MKPTPLPDEAPPDLDGVDPLSYRAFLAFVRVLHAHRQLMFKAVGEEGGHPAQAGCLRVLVAHDGISQRDLAERLFLNPPAVTTMLQRMERAGVIERRPDPDDQRLTRVHLTDRGRVLEGRVRTRIAGNIGRMFEGMTEDDRIQLERLLRTVADNTTRDTMKAAE